MSPRKSLIRPATGVLLLAACFGGAAVTTDLCWAAAVVEGKYVKLKEPSTHTPGKVKLTEFADFYCPHCHVFEQSAIPMLEQEFGEKVEVEMIGFPVIRGMLPTPFMMYEQAKLMGKGPEMKKALFRTIHRDRIAIFDRTIRGILAREVELDAAEFEAGLASGLPAKAFAEGRQWGERVQVSSTPTVVLDGNLKIEGENLTSDNLKAVIRSILDADAKG